MFHCGTNKTVLLIRAAFIVFALYTFDVAAQEILPEANAESLASKIDKLIDTGRKSLQSGDVEAAVRAYQEVLRLDPNKAEALYQLAIYHFKKKDYARGLELIKKAVEASPENPFPRMALAKALGETGNYEDAIKQYEQVLKAIDLDSRPGQTALLEMNMLIFRQAARRRDREQVFQIGQQLTQKYKANPTVLELVASVYVQAGFVQQAKELYEELLNYAPDNPAIEFYLAGVYERLRNPEQAMLHYERAIDKGEGMPVARSAQIKLGLLQAFSFLHQGDKENASQQFKAVLELDENNIIANMNLAGILHEKKELEQAKQIYQHVIKLQPENLDAHYRLAIVYLDMNDALNGVRELDFIVARAPKSPAAQSARQTLDRAGQRWRLDVLRKAISDEETFSAKLAQNPNDAATLTAMGGLLMRQRRRDEAIKYFEDAIQADQNYGEAYVRAGLYYEDTRDFEKAVNTYQRALALIPDDARIEMLRERLTIASGNMYLDKEEYKKAEEYFLEAYENAKVKEKELGDSAVEPGEAKGPAVDIIVLWGLAMTYAKQGNLQESIKWYEQVIDMAPQHIGARFNAARTYEQMEEEKQAIAHYKAIIFSKNATPENKKRAENRLDIIRRQTNGFSYTAGYLMDFNDNLNNARVNKYFEYRSDVYGGATYNYKIKKGVKLSVNATASYSIYHRAQFDFFNFTLSPSLKFNKQGYNWDVGLSRNSQSSVLRPEQSSTITETFRLGADWAGRDRVGYRAFMTYRGFGSTLNPFLDADTVNLGINRNHSGPEQTFLSYGYTLTVNENNNILGNDYAYVGNGVNGRIDKRFDNKLTGNINGRVGLNIYTNPDSSTNFMRYRRTFSFGVGAGVDYRYASWVSFVARYNFFTQYSNLPVGFIFNELQAIEGQQSTSLGSYVSNSISVGVRMNF